MTTFPLGLRAGHVGWLDRRPPSTLAADPATSAAATATAVVPAVHVEAFRPEVEGLRGIAVVLVVLFHADLVALAGGFVGVDVFFVISGFLITALLLRERERTGRIGFLGFYARRARRLMPAALVALVVTLVAAAAVVAPLDRPGVALDGAAAAVSVANIRFALAEGDYFTFMASPSPFLHFWSLGVEEQFYLVWPALLLLGARGRRPRLGAAIVLAAVLVGSFAACVIVTDVAPGWAFYSLPTRAWQLATGGLLAIGASALTRLPGPPMAALGWVGLAALLAAPVMIDASVAYPGVAALLPTLGVAALIAAGERRHGPAGLLSLAPVRFLGRISYSLYLWHWPILVLPAIAAGTSLEPGTRLGLVLLSVFVATLSWAFVEEPFRRGLPGLVRNPRRTLAVAGVALTFVISFAGGISARQVTDLDSLAASASATTPGEDSPDGTAAEPTSDDEWAANDEWVANDGEAGIPTGDGWTAGDGEPANEPGLVAGRAEPGTEPPDPTAGGADGTAGPSPSAASTGAAPSPSPTARPTATPQVYVHLPHDVRPALARARDDKERLWRDGCLASQGATRPRDCVYGNPKGSFTVALVGDSHASHLFPALEAVARKHGWRLLALVKVSCPFIDMRVRNIYLKREYTECSRFRDAVLARLAAADVDLVVVSNSRWTYPVLREDATVARQGAALARMIAHLPGRVAVVADTPAADRDIPACLSAHVTDIRLCAVPRSTAFSGAMLVRERAATRATGAGLVNLTAAVCPANPCPAVVRGMIVLRDDHHLTATFARSLAPLLDRALARILAPAPAASPSASPAPTTPSPQPASGAEAGQRSSRKDTARIW